MCSGQQSVYNGNGVTVRASAIMGSTCTRRTLYPPTWHSQGLLNGTSMEILGTPTAAAVVCEAHRTENTGKSMPTPRTAVS